MAANTYAQILKYGLQASYNNIQSKDANVLYFCTDTGKIYKGDIDFTNMVVVADSKPATPIVGKLYVLADSDTVEAYTASGWVVVSKAVATTIDKDSTNDKVASAKAVYDAIQAAVEDLAGSEDTIKSVEAGTTEAAIKVTKGDDSSSEFTVKGVVTTPTWDATARKLTLPVSGGTSVEVEIGKDIFIDPSADNKYNPETGNIELYLNDGAGGAATKIEVPASSLVDVYTGGTTDSATVAVSDDNVVTATVKVDSAEGNAITVTANGLRVDLGDYAKSEAVQEKLDEIDEHLVSIDIKNDRLEGEINTLNSDAQTEGSVDYKIAQAKNDFIDAQIEPLINELDTVSDVADQAAADILVLNGDAQTEGSVDYKIAQAKEELSGDVSALEERVATLEGEMDTAQADITTNAENIAALAAATTGWGTF